MCYYIALITAARLIVSFILISSSFMSPVPLFNRKGNFVIKVFSYYTPPDVDYVIPLPKIYRETGLL